MAYPRQLDGADLLGWAESAVALLNARRADINALNVFPVPDSDTGSNMAHTMTSALEQAHKLDDAARGSASAVAEALAAGSVRGARGNSGVVLSQVLRGVAHAASRGTIDGKAIVEALTTARTMVEKAIADPVEGTVITVLRAAATAATAAADQASDGDLHHVLTAAVTAATTALSQTTHQLPALRDAGVVDAGGQGLVLLLQALLNLVEGADADSFHMTAPAATLTTTSAQSAAQQGTRGATSGHDAFSTDDAQASDGAQKSHGTPAGQHAAGEETSGSHAACDAATATSATGASAGAGGMASELEIMAYLADTDLDALSQTLDKLGDCLVIARASDTEGTVHIHTPAATAGQAIDAIYSHGTVSDLRLEILPPAPATNTSPRPNARGSIVIALVPPGPLAELLRNEGALTIDPTGKDDDALARMIAEQLDEDTTSALVLGNGLASDNLLEEIQRDPRILTLNTSTLAAGLAALAVYDPSQPLAEARSAMEDTISSMRTCTIAPVDSACLTAVGAANRGDYAATTPTGEIIAVDSDLLTCAATASTTLLGDTGELLTLLVGAEHAHNITPQALREHLSRTHTLNTHGTSAPTTAALDLDAIDITVYPLGEVNHAIEIGAE